MITPFPERISPAELRNIYSNEGNPFYIYDEKTILEHVYKIRKNFQAIDFTLYYALKANAHGFFIKLFHRQGLNFDASSIFEVLRLVQAGVPPDRITLTSQEFPNDLAEHYKPPAHHFFYNATSISQIERFGKLFPGEAIGIRVNPGMGSGMKGKTNVAGKNSSFGIWHEDLPTAKKVIKKYDLKIKKIHTHIGSGTDPKVWSKVAKISISFLENFPRATTINLGGGFKVARNLQEEDVNMDLVGEEINRHLKDFCEKNQRKIALELEPGGFLMASSGLLVSEVNDVVSTEKGVQPFIKLNVGLNDFIRPAMYGAQHKMEIINQGEEKENYYVVGHCCEEGDTLHTKLNQPTEKEAVSLNKASLGDLFLIHGVGAYSRSMASNYNSFPLIAEFVKTTDGKIKKITRRQTIKDLTMNEIGH